MKLPNTMKTRDGLVEKIIKEYREKFGLCMAKDEKCKCYKELKWLKKTFLKISDASIKDYEEKLWAACDTDEDTDALVLGYFIRRQP